MNISNWLFGRKEKAHPILLVRNHRGFSVEFYVKNTRFENSSSVEIHVVCKELDIENYTCVSSNVDHIKTGFENLFSMVRMEIDSFMDYDKNIQKAVSML